MKICIVGWYGTETLGDRAILDGMFILFERTYKNYEISLGSLYPFFTERTFFEDESFYKKNAPNLKYSIFDVRGKALIREIIECDVLIMGGGPLMDVDELRIILKAFKIAKKNGKKTIVFGCGLGPLRKSKNIKMVQHILELTDICMFRDHLSGELCDELFGEKINYSIIHDPAIISALNYKNNIKNYTVKQKQFVINIRRFPDVYGNCVNMEAESIANLVAVSKQYFNEVLFVPMHTFFIGGDDREYYTEVLGEIDDERIKIQYKPLSLEQTYAAYMEAEACIGMRYHSIVFQTILNGNNYIIDYTNKNYGKISGFIDSLNTSFYKNRYMNIQENEKQLSNLLNNYQSDNNYEFYLNLDKEFDLIKRLLLS